MLVSHQKKFIYIKTVKTAGSSVEVALQGYCVPPDMMPHGKTAEIETGYGIVGARGVGMDSARWYNHMPAKKIRNQLSGETWDGYCKICNIRNPWDKTVSWFHFKRPDIKKGSEVEIIKEFRMWLSSDDSRIGQDSHIYFINGQPIADEYIRYENLQADFDKICEKLKIEPKLLPRLKSLQRGKERIPYQNFYDNALQEKIAKKISKRIGRIRVEIFLGKPRTTVVV